MNLPGAGRWEEALEFKKWRPPWISVALLYLRRNPASGSKDRNLIVQLVTTRAVARNVGKVGSRGLDGTQCLARERVGNLIWVKRFTSHSKW